MVTMAEDVSPASIRDKKGETSEPGVEGEDGGRVTAVVASRDDQSQRSGVEVGPLLAPEKDDMVQMEDIKDCKVTQSATAGVEEEVEEEGKVVKTQSKQD